MYGKLSLFVVVVFVCLLVSLLSGCGGPSWCNEKMRLYKNVEYGYDLFFPPRSELTTYWGGSAAVLIDDGVSDIHVTVYDWGNASYYADNFLKLMEERNEAKGTLYEVMVGANMNWNYEVKHRSGNYDEVAGITYTCLKAVYEGANPTPVKTVKVDGDIVWYRGKYGDKEYIYCLQTEIPLDCECCDRLLDVSFFEFYSSISPQ